MQLLGRCLLGRQSHPGDHGWRRILKHGITFDVAVAAIAVILIVDFDVVAAQRHGG